MHDAGEGVYTVSWQVVSQDDGHFTKGGFSFGVGTDAIPVDSSADEIQVGFSSPYSQAGAIGLELVGQTMFLAVIIAIAMLWARAVFTQNHAGAGRSLPARLPPYGGRGDRPDCDWRRRVPHSQDYRSSGQPRDVVCVHVSDFRRNCGWTIRRVSIDSRRSLRDLFFSRQKNEFSPPMRFLCTKAFWRRCWR
jgi:hypothetical protein